VMAAREPIPVAYRRTAAGTCEEIAGSRSAQYRRLEPAPAPSFAPATETMR
jgi:hypothetical protein